MKQLSTLLLVILGVDLNPGKAQTTIPVLPHSQQVAGIDTLRNDSNLVVKGNLTAHGSLNFSGDKTITYLAPSSLGREVYLFGEHSTSTVDFLRRSGPGTSTPCNNPGTINGFNGGLLSYSCNPISKTYISMQMGVDGANGILDVAGTNQVGNAGLLINYYCGMPVDICTGENGGNVNICNGPGTNPGKVFLGITHVGPQAQTAAGPHGDAILSVSGKMVAQSCYVTAKHWADRVFDPGYRLTPLPDVEAYYLSHKHLKDIPTEQEVQENGIEVADMNCLLLQKVEELTRYVVELQKLVEAEQVEITLLKRRIKNQKR